jgi:hypothetical protein
MKNQIARIHNKTAQLKVENSAQTTLRISPVSSLAAQLNINFEGATTFR